MRVHSFSRIVTLAGGLSVVLTGVYFACIWGVAYVEDFMVKSQLESWVTGELIPNRNQWQQTHESMAMVLKLEAGNADYQSDMAELYQYKADYLAVGASAVEALMQQSLTHFREATRLRPAWPHAWAHIAVVKSRMNVLDEEFYHAFDRAVSLGAAVPPVQYLLSFAAFSRWQALTRSYREKAIDNAIHGLSNKQGKQILATLIQYGLISLVCTASPMPEVAKYYCKKAANK